MNKNGRIKQRSVWKKALIPFALAIAIAVTGCKQDFTPDQEVTVDGGLPPVPETPLTDPVRDGISLEALDRGLVVMPSDDGNVLSWRFLGSDSQKVSFKIFKNGDSLTNNYVIDKTMFVDSDGTVDDVYQVIAYVNEVAVDSSKEATVWSNPFLSIPLDKPANGFINGTEFSYSANDASVADLDGDGQYEVLVKWYPSNSKDNGQAGDTGDTYIDAYTLEGYKLWRINLGPNIRSGAHYTQFIAFDFDQDGRAELAMKTADGTVDGRGTIIGDADAIYRNEDGYVLDGPEFLTMFDGLSGAALDTIPYNPPRGTVGDWGDTWGNRVDRFLAGVAHFDGQRPSLFMSRGYYTRVVVAAYDWMDGQFVERWVFDTDNGGEDAAAEGQGAHSLSVADVDSDGFDEIIFGAATIDDDGSLLYSTDLGHGDALHVSDLDPNRPGLEVYMVHESPSQYTIDDIEYGVEMHDAETGEILWYRSGDSDDVGRGVSADVDPNYPGNESWGTRGGMVAADGTVILEGTTERPDQINFAIWWDGDLLRELLDGTSVFKWNPTTQLSESIFEAAQFDAVSNNGTKMTPSLSADIFGDWREEVMFANSDSTELRIFSTYEETELRLPTLMHDLQYRQAIAWQNVGYNQPPHPSFFLGNETDTSLLAKRELPQFTINTNELGELKQLVAQGDADSVQINVYLNNVDAAQIEIFRNTVDSVSGRESITTLSGGQASFDDATAMPDVTYYYWAVLSDASGEVIDELAFSKTSLTSSLIPKVLINAASGNDNIQLSWATENIESPFIAVYRAETDAEGTIPDISERVLVANPPSSATSFVDDTTLEGTKYYYWVEFEPTAGDVVSTEPTFAEHFLTLRTNMTSTYTPDGVFVEWNLENFPEITETQFYRNTVNQLGGRTRLTIISGADAITGSFLDTTAEEGVTYWYMHKLTVAADNSTLNTDPEAEITFSPNITNLEAVYSGQQISVTWNLQNFGQEIEYVELYRNTSNQLGGRTRIVAGADLSGTFVDTEDLVDGTTYWYMFKIRLADGTTVNTDPDAETQYSLPVPKANLFSMLSGGGISLSWNLEDFLQDIEGIELYRNTVEALDGRERIAQALDPQGTFLDSSNLVEDQGYWYMFKVTLADGTVVNTDPEANIVFEAAPVITSVTIEENTPGFCSVDGTVDDNNAGFTGTGFANTDNEEGKAIYYRINVTEAATYNVTFVQANGSSDNRWGRVDANGTEVFAKLDLNPTGGWTTYLPVTVAMDLPVGEIDFNFVARTAGGLSNIDSLTIESTTGGNAPAPVPCD